MNQFKKEYGNEINEVLSFLESTDEKLSQKIPVVFKEFLIENRAKPIPPKLDAPILFNAMSPKAKQIVMAIYANWWCTDKQRNSYLKRINEHEFKEKFNM